MTQAWRHDGQPENYVNIEESGNGPWRKGEMSQDDVIWVHESNHACHLTFLLLEATNFSYKSLWVRGLLIYKFKNSKVVNNSYVSFNFRFYPLASLLSSSSLTLPFEWQPLSPNFPSPKPPSWPDNWAHSDQQFLNVPCGRITLKTNFQALAPEFLDPVGLEIVTICNSKTSQMMRNHCSRHAGLLSLFLICLNIQRTLPVQGLHTGCSFFQEDTFPGYLCVTEFWQILNDWDALWSSLLRLWTSNAQVWVQSMVGELHSQHTSWCS